MEKLTQVKLSDLPTFESNPFVEKAIEKISENTTKKLRWIKGNQVVQHYLENEEGKVVAHAAFLQQIEVDEEKFAKLYLSQLGFFFDLPKPAMRVFTYILNNLQPKTDRFFLVMKEALSYTQYKEEKSIFTGLAYLCDKGLIARSETHYMYYINPLVFFNGDRVTFAKTYVRNRKKAVIEDPNQLKISFDNDITSLQSEYDKAE